MPASGFSLFTFSSKSLKKTQTSADHGLGRNGKRVDDRWRECLCWFPRQLRTKDEMSNSKRLHKGDRLWLPSLLLLFGQFLTMAPVLVIIFANEQQRTASDEYAALLDGLDRLAFAIAQLGAVSPGAAANPKDRRDMAVISKLWEGRYGPYQRELKQMLANRAATGQIGDILRRVDSTVDQMSETMSDPIAFSNAAQLAGAEVLSAQHTLRIRLSGADQSVTQKTAYLKAFLPGACMLAFGVVLVVRKFRIASQTERKLQQELRTTNEEVIAALAAARSEASAKNDLLANIGSRMRTPLNGILSRIEELLATELTERQRDCARSSQALASSLTKVADQAIDYSKMESGRFELEPVEFEPAKVIADVLDLFGVAAERKGLKVKSALAEHVPAKVKGDPGVLRQVLVNLASNAVRFTEKGEVVLGVNEIGSTEGGTILCFEVRDTGIGMTDEVRGRIFQPFLPGRHGSKAQGGEGVGLGLVISKKLTELMGGKIEVDTEPGVGSTFSFTAAFETVRPGTEAQNEPAKPAATPAPEEQSLSVPRTHNGIHIARERRSEARQGISYPTLLRSKVAGVAVVRILDVSASGVRVSVPFKLDVDTAVEIRIEGISVDGTVRNCVCIRPNEFHVGIHIPNPVSADGESLHHLRLLRAVRTSSRS